MQPRIQNPQDPEAPSCCPHCSHSPCLLFQGLYLSIVHEYEDDIPRDEAGDPVLTNKQIRFILYRHATNWIHGFLGKGKRKQLPICVRGEILDFAPQDDHVYVGFRPSGSSSRDESA